MYCFVCFLITTLEWFNPPFGARVFVGQTAVCGTKTHLASIKNDMDKPSRVTAFIECSNSAQACVRWTQQFRASAMFPQLITLHTYKLRLALIMPYTTQKFLTPLTQNIINSNLINLLTQNLINSLTQNLTNSLTQKLINSKTYKLINPKTYKLKNL